VGLRTSEPSFLIGHHQSALADHICAKGRDESALDFVRYGPPFAQLTAAQRNPRTDQV
jgi:hypothetical protein